MHRARALTAFTLAIWLLTLAVTYIINVTPYSESSTKYPIPFALAVGEVLIIVWPLYFVFGIKSWPRIVSGGALSGIVAAVANYFKLHERVVNHLNWPTNYRGIFISDNSGNVNAKFWLVVAAFGFVGFVIYVLPAWLAKRVTEHS